MPGSVHGHAILNLLIEAREPLTRDALRQIAAEEFGPDARYHTCSADSMSFDDLIAFLCRRGKVTEQGGRLIVHAEEMCSHN